MKLKSEPVHTTRTKEIDANTYVPIPTKEQHFLWSYKIRIYTKKSCKTLLISLPDVCVLIGTLRQKIPPLNVNIILGCNHCTSFIVYVYPNETPRRTGLDPF